MIYLNSASYNVYVAKIFGVCSAAFLTCINDEFLRQKRANTLNANNTVAITRAEIYERTGLEDTKQVEVEEALTSCGVISTKPLKNVPNKNYYILNNEQLDKIVNAVKPEDVIIESKAKQFIKAPRVEPMSKRQTHIASLKKRLKHDDQIVLQYLCDWIDAVYTNPKGFLSPSGVDIALQELKAYAKDNQEKQIEILKIAIKGGLRDITWAIQNYEKQNNINTSNNFVSYNDIKSNGQNIVDEAF